MSKQFTKALVLTSLLMGATGIVSAAPMEEAFALDKVVVTATRTANLVSKTPANVSIITGADLEKAHYADVAQVLKDLPGVLADTYGSGVGYENSNRFLMNGSGNVVLMIDGIILNAEGVNPPLYNLKNLKNIERIEVVKGASSALYGSAAVGGVINIITKKETKEFGGTVSVEGGSYNHEQYNVNVGGSQDGWQWRVGAQKRLEGDYFDAHGLRIPQHLDSKNVSFMIGHGRDAGNRVDFFFDRNKAKMTYSDSNKKLDKVKHGEVDYRTARLVWKHDLQEDLKGQVTALDSSHFSNYNGYKLDVRTRGLAGQLIYYKGNHTVVGGVDWRQNTVRHMNNLKITNTSYFIQDEWQFDEGWTFTPGLRYDHHSGFGDYVSPHIALSHTIDNHTTAYISYNKFFVAPSPTNLFSPKYGNPNMKPETGYSWEMGVRHQFDDSLHGDIHAFWRVSKDKIGYDRAIGKYANLDEEKAKGFEANVEKRFNENLTASLGYTFTDVGETSQRAKNVDGYIPKHAVVMKVKYAQDDMDAQLTVRGSISRPGPQTADALPNFFPKTTYWITDVSANYYVNDSIRIFGRVNNLFDVFYAENSNARGNWGGVPDEWWTNPGRNYQVGMEVKF